MHSFSQLKRLSAFFGNQYIVTLTLILLAAGTGFANLSQTFNGTVDATFTGGVTEGKVQVLTTEVLADGKILVGGGFSLANGVEKNTLVRLNADGTLDTTFNPGGSGPTSSVYDIAILPDGKIIIAGLFGSYNGIAKGGVTKLNADGTLDATFNSGGTGLTGTAHTISLQADGKILISGSILAYNGTAKFAVIRLNADGSLDTGFVTPFMGNQFVEEVDYQPDGKIVIGGGFTIGSPARSGVARLNADGSLDTTFNAGGGGTNDGVLAVQLQPDGKILIGGQFTAYNGTARSNVARLNTDGTLDTSLTFNFGVNPITTIQVEYLVIQPDGNILVGGLFRLNPTVTIGMVRVATNGTLNSPVLASVDNLVYHISQQADGKILIGGFFNRFASQPRNNLVRLNTDFLPDNTFIPSFVGFGYVTAIAQQADSKIIAVGNFNFANAETRSNIARFNTNGSLDTTFTTGAGTFADSGTGSNIVNTVAVQSDGKVIIGGAFGSYSGTSRRSIMRLNTDGTLDTTFSAESYFSPLTTSNVSDILILPDSRIMVAGLFFNGGGPGIAHGVIRLNSDGSLDTGFAPITVNAGVTKLSLQPDGKILIGGGFTNLNGQNRSRLTRINFDGSFDSSFNVGTGANATIQTIALLAGGKIIIGGNFTTYNTVNAVRTARLNSDGTLDTAFSTGTGANGSVESIAVQPDGKIIIGGRFANVNGTTINRLARLNSDGSLDGTFTSGFDGDTRFFVRRVQLQNDGKLLVGGLFKTYSGSTRNALVRLLTNSTSRSVPFDFDGDRKADISVFRPDNGVWYLQQSTAGFTGIAFGVGTDKLAPADFDGDGKTDVAVYRAGIWYLQRSAAGFTGVAFGGSNDVPQPGDYDGDGKADLAVYRPSNGTWYVYNLATNQTTGIAFGALTDKPVAADYDGDGKFDYAVLRSGVWYIQQSSAGFTGVTFGASSDLPVPADFDGDGKTDIAVFRPATGTWYLLQSSAGFTGIGFGAGTDLPVPADYDGDGKADVAVFRSGVWYVLQSTAGFIGVTFGASTDKPIPNFYNFQ